MFKNHLRHLENIRIGELLLNKGLISKATLEAAIQTQQATKRKIGEILISEGHLSQRQLRKVLREQRAIKVLATVLLTSGAAVAASPQLLAPTHSRPIAQKSGEKIGGGRLRYDGRTNNRTSYRNTTKGQPDFMRVSLRDNPRPTVHSPLIGFCHPMNGRGYLSQGNNGITHRGRMAYAYDLASPIGTPIYAMRAGKVVGLQDKYPDTGGGRSKISKFNYVWLEHDGGYRSAYLHMQQDFLDAVNLKKGAYVEAGQLIGYSGNSGWSTGPHLHIEVQKPGRKRGFNKSIPFEVSGRCQSPSIARTQPSKSGS